MVTADYLVVGLDGRCLRPCARAHEALRHGSAVSALLLVACLQVPLPVDASVAVHVHQHLGAAPLTAGTWSGPPVVGAADNEWLLVSTPALALLFA